MTNTFVKFAVGVSVVMFVSSSTALAGRGGGYGGGRGGGYGGYGGSAGRGGGAASGGYGNRNQSGNPSNAGAAAAGAGYSNRNQQQYPNAGAATAGAGYANRNQSAYPNAGAAAAGAGYANRNQSAYPNAGAAAAGAEYANHNESAYPYGGAAAAGYWGGNNGMGGGGGVGAWGAGSPMYGYGYSGYNNPYATGGLGGAGIGQPATQIQPTAPTGYDYSQPLNTAAAAPEPSAADQASTAFDQACNAFKAGDTTTAIQLVQQSLAQMPNDASMHEFLALALFAQGKYEQAASPLYAVLSVGPGWNWTTLIGHYADAGPYTEQLRALETYVRANPGSAQSQFLLAYHYIVQGHTDAAADRLKQVVAIQPNDTLSAQLLAKLQPSSAPAGVAPLAPPQPTPFDAGKLTGDWVGQSPQNAKVALSIKEDGSFAWTVSPPGKPPVTIAGKSQVDSGLLTLDDKSSKMGPLTGQVTWQDDSHFNFRVMGAPLNDPGITFTH